MALVSELTGWLPLPDWLHARLRGISNVRALALLLICGVSMSYLRSRIRFALAQKYLIKAKARKNAERESLYKSLIAETSSPSDSPLSSQDHVILSNNPNVSTLVSTLTNKQLTCVDFIQAILRQTMRAHNKFNCLTETCFQQAITQAKLLDQWLETRGTPKGNLHGVPITLKDSVNVLGLDTTLGLVGHAFQPANQDALIVKILKNAGAIIYAKTNVPQTLLSFECCNPLFGTTVNPYGASWTCGGSSGGESVMVACRASMVGIGTDIGGSVRIPAHFSGNFAIKPTARRLSTKGFRPSVPGQEAIPGVAGVITNSVDDIITVLNELFVQDVWDADHEIIPLPFDVDECMNSSLLRVGYYLDDGVVPPSPACARAVTEVVDALRAAGHHVQEFQPPRVIDAIAMYYALMSADGGYTLTNQLQRDVYEDYVSTLISAIRMPKLIKRTIAAFIQNVLKDEKAAKIMAASGERTVAQTWKLQADRKRYRAEFFDAWQREGNKFDVILCPAHALPAVGHGSYKSISYTCSYTMLYNLLDLPAGVVPITQVKGTDLYTSPADSLLEKMTRKFYNPEMQAGLPVGVQVVGLPFEDETVLRAMRVISSLKPFTAVPSLIQSSQD